MLLLQASYSFNLSRYGLSQHAFTTCASAWRLFTGELTGQSTCYPRLSEGEQLDLLGYFMWTPSSSGHWARHALVYDGRLSRLQDWAGRAVAIFMPRVAGYI